MLHHINESATAERVQAGIEQVYREGKTLTRDVGGTSGTKAFAEAVLQAMEAPVIQA
jgi:isocitrate dehydrogenase (NAD+)